MQQVIANILKKITEFLEFVISIMLALGIILLCFRIAVSLIHIPNLEVWPNYDDLLENCYHTPDTVFEVLLFAIARQIITDHSSIWGSLVGVSAIAVLFATRKYLFCEFDISDAIIFRASARVKSINTLLGINIPYENNDRLMDVLIRSLESENQVPRVGACAYFTDVGLRVAKLHNEKISRIEVIRSIH